MKIDENIWSFFDLRFWWKFWFFDQPDEILPKMKIFDHFFLPRKSGRVFLEIMTKNFSWKMRDFFTFKSTLKMEKRHQLHFFLLIGKNGGLAKHILIQTNGTDPLILGHTVPFFWGSWKTNFPGASCFLIFDENIWSFLMISPC